jgi:hypothetical protein
MSGCSGPVERVADGERSNQRLTMVKGKMIYEGKAKKLFATDQPGRVIQYF